MELKTHQSGTVEILELAGRFDAYAAPAVAAWLDRVSQIEEVKVLVNMNEVGFIDSTGLATLVQGMKRVRQQKGDLYLCGLQVPVKVIFELTRLDKAIGLFEKESQALTAFEKFDYAREYQF